MKSKEEDICAGQTLLSPSGWEALHGEPVEGRLFTASFKFTQVSKLNSRWKCFDDAKKTLRAECASLKMKFRKDVAASLDGWALEGNFRNIIP